MTDWRHQDPVIRIRLTDSRHEHQIGYNLGLGYLGYKLGFGYLGYKLGLGLWDVVGLRFMGYKWGLRHLGYMLALGFNLSRWGNQNIRL